MAASTSGTTCPTTGRYTTMRDSTRAAERARDRGKPAGQRKAQGRLVEGQAVTNWKQALAQLAAAYPDRINPYL